MLPEVSISLKEGFGSFSIRGIFSHLLFALFSTLTWIQREGKFTKGREISV
jgi:hypothetical protein